jgi:hypothetical protein
MRPATEERMAAWALAGSSKASTARGSWIAVLVQEVGRGRPARRRSVDDAREAGDALGEGAAEGGVGRWGWSAAIRHDLSGSGCKEIEVTSGYGRRKKRKEKRERKTNEKVT